MSGRCFGLPAAAVAVAMVASLATPARAQEATNTPAATQPAAGNIAVRQKLQYFDRDAAPGTGADPDGWTATTRLTLGLRRDLSLSLDVPVEFAVPARSPGAALVSPSRRRARGAGAGCATLVSPPAPASRNGLAYAALAWASISSATSSSARLKAS